MLKIIGYCGLVCTDCPTYIATQKNDDVAREKIAAAYSKKFGFSIKAKEINCDGCLSNEGRLIGYCKACNIRKCCRAKRLANCTLCPEESCDYLKNFHAFSPKAKDSYKKLKN
jgi:hypothetical protein